MVQPLYEIRNNSLYLSLLKTYETTSSRCKYIPSTEFLIDFFFFYCFLLYRFGHICFVFLDVPVKDPVLGGFRISCLEFPFHGVVREKAYILKSLILRTIPIGNKH